MIIKRVIKEIDDNLVKFEPVNGYPDGFISPFTINYKFGECHLDVDSPCDRINAISFDIGETWEWL